jgi:thiamine phosphate synthase YjbQ (UPF0047 family)
VTAATLINEANLSAMQADVKGDIYEGLLSRSAADEYGKELDKDQKKHLRTKFISDSELVPNTSRLSWC